jgi:hypothetical protein
MDDAEQLPPGLVLTSGTAATTKKLGRMPSHSVQEVIEAAVELADAGGLDQLT